ncbi:MAG: 5-formyltetrahydrofolate cyclo-ligase [Candidatus Omnitrophica bacterium]|nr:5-formyltetrahydrofolate cyclo-ligase [Candidatus Omnitrophota bacterium]MDE2009560.1 5-formyltetrahydrofolate cyclo-ligase [Candidatus Omnitrophota bacterium]MDE2214604.1 5-formyltetrahydrofolate cyclo-ligase [Candidatus Omnitrophota bacterium]MDE2231681.1 5-formyltetrahydrofolate cyclo-ligase [Candidatus Omnitrophota bacterium]
MKDKSSLRAYYLKLLGEQDKEQCARKSHLVAEQFWQLPSVQKARHILFYVSMPGEVDTSAMIHKAFYLGKRVALPIVEQNQRKLIPTFISSMEDVHKGAYGIPEPYFDPQKTAAAKDLDAAVVPGLAFDRLHHRLGRGAGYYDRFLSTLPDRVTTIGLAFDFQLTESLPTEAHDMPLSQVIAA